MNFPLEVDYSDPKKDKAAFVILRSFFLWLLSFMQDLYSYGQLQVISTNKTSFTECNNPIEITSWN